MLIGSYVRACINNVSSVLSIAILRALHFVLPSTPASAVQSIDTASPPGLNVPLKSKESAFEWEQMHLPVVASPYISILHINIYILLMCACLPVEYGLLMYQLSRILLMMFMLVLLVCPANAALITYFVKVLGAELSPRRLAVDVCMLWYYMAKSRFQRLFD